MFRSHLDAILKFLAESKGVESLNKSIFTAQNGWRGWPKPKDSHIPGIRMDWGSKYEINGEWFRNLVVQPNKEATQPALKALAKKSTHQTLGKIRAPMNRPITAKFLGRALRVISHAEPGELKDPIVDTPEDYVEED